jgi:hypothetical protein
MLSTLSQPLPVLVSPGNKENPPILDHVRRPAESLTHALDPGATSENTLNQKSPVFVTPKLILCGVEESSNAYPPLKSVVRHLSVILDHCEVQSSSPAFNPQCSQPC